MAEIITIAMALFIIMIIYFERPPREIYLYSCEIWKPYLYLKNYVLVFPDFPGICVQDPDLTDALMMAGERLKTEIVRRLKNDESLPIPGPACKNIESCKIRVNVTKFKIKLRGE